ncbi:MAG: hypothetical protein HY714_06580 [Candidatus Omnitrophica bacterium]|nr:hypothetical protein [Candidatus Omnitrophota bacterium]
MVSLSSPANVRADSGPVWTPLKGKHFIVYMEAESGRAGAEFLYFGQSVLKEAEKHYQKIASAIGHSSYQDPWLWDRRCAVYIYASKRSYLKGARMPGWSNAAASFENVPTIRAYLGADDFLGTQLPHEITHLLMRQFVGVGNASVPRWIDEGVALWFEESGRAREMDDWVSVEAAQGRHISIARLTGLSDPSLAPASPDQGLNQSVSLFYAESFSVVNFLMERFGQARFVELLRQFKKGSDVETALRKAYGASVRDLEALEQEWLRSLNVTRAS